MEDEAVRTAGGTPEAYPLVFSFRDILAGRNFMVSVETRGRLVLAREDGCWTVYGGNPGGVAGGGESAPAALTDFRRGYFDVLDDIAHEATDFAAFKAAVEAVVHQPSEDVVREWAELRERVRAGEINLENVERRDTSDFVPSVLVRRIEQEPAPPAVRPAPDLNPVQVFLEAA